MKHWRSDYSRVWIKYNDGDEWSYESRINWEEVCVQAVLGDTASSCVLAQRVPHDDILLSEKRIAKLELHYGLCLDPSVYREESVIFRMEQLYPIEWRLSPFSCNDSRDVEIVELHVRFGGLITYNAM